MQPLMEAGLDSIGAVELRNAVSSAFGLDLPATATFDYPSTDALAKYIASKRSIASTEQAGWADPKLVPVRTVDSTALIQQIAQDLSEITSGERWISSLSPARSGG